MPRADHPPPVKSNSNHSLTHSHKSRRSRPIRRPRPGQSPSPRDPPPAGPTCHPQPKATTRPLSLLPISRFYFPHSILFTPPPLPTSPAAAAAGLSPTSPAAAAASTQRPWTGARSPSPAQPVPAERESCHRGSVSKCWRGATWVAETSAYLGRWQRSSVHRLRI